MKYLSYHILRNTAVVWLAVSLSLLTARISAAGVNVLPLRTDPMVINLNLYQFAGNFAAVPLADSLHWLGFEMNSYNDWGELHRLWDAKGNHLHSTGFSGQKTSDRGQVFIGRVDYNWDMREDQQYAIEKYPYAGDPFVLSDKYVGDILFHGPSICAGISQRVGSQWLFGGALNYQIDHGYKEQFTQPEFITRDAGGQFDVLFLHDEKHQWGVSVAASEEQDITTLQEQSDGFDPITRRYRGEFLYREYVSDYTRTAVLRRYKLRPQYALVTEQVQLTAFAGYGLNQLELYDGTTVRRYDGYYQQKVYEIQTAVRYRLPGDGDAFLFGEYGYLKSDGWAKESNTGFLIGEYGTSRHEVKLGWLGTPGRNMLTWKITTSLMAEILRQDDYLAGVYRQAPIAEGNLAVDLRWRLNPAIELDAGIQYGRYYEDKVWNYFGDYSQIVARSGFSWNWADMAIRLKATAGQASGAENGKKRHYLMIQTYLEQSL
jgi:hypothetical protein